MRSGSPLVTQETTSGQIQLPPLIICQGGVRASKRERKRCGERVKGVERKDSVLDVYSYTHLKAQHTHTDALSRSRETDSVHCVSLEFSLHLWSTLSFYSHDAAEKEEFYFWSIWRVRAVYPDVSPSLIPFACLCAVKCDLQTSVCHCGYGRAVS